MELITLLLSTALFLVAFLFLLRQGLKRARFVSLVNKLPGPPAYPIIGNSLDMVVPRNRKYETSVRREMGPAQFQAVRETHPASCQADKAR
jgi:hypothetical protein